MSLLLVGLFLFLGIHLTGAFGMRETMVERTGGEGPWKGLYSLVSLVGLVCITMGYAEARAAPSVLWVPPVWTRHLALTLMLPVFPMLFAAYLPGRIQSTLKHPMLVATKTWALAHLLANGMLHDVLLFGGFLAWAVIVRISLGRREPRDIPMAPPSGLNDGIAVVGGLMLYGATLMKVHLWLFGVPPLAMG